jgi:hypothetical protein
MALLPRLRWMFQMVAETLELTSGSDVEVVMRDPDAATLLNLFFKGPVEAVAFLFQSKEVRSRLVLSYDLTCAPLLHRRHPAATSQRRHL